MINLFFRKNFVKVVAALALLSVAELSAAEQAFLTVSGTITKGTDHKWALTQAEFDALPQHTIATTTSWTQGVHKFTGPLMRDVMRLSGSTSDKMVAYGVDDYIQRYPTADFAKYDVIIASKMDGKPLPLDTYGPMWIVYPRDDFPKELKNVMTDGKFAWQVNRIEFK
jgi:hypothetical protein